MRKFFARLFCRNTRIINIGKGTSYTVPREAWPELLGKKAGA